MIIVMFIFTCIFLSARIHVDVYISYKGVRLTLISIVIFFMLLDHDICTYYKQQGAYSRFH